MDKPPVMPVDARIAQFTPELFHIRTPPIKDFVLNALHAAPNNFWTGRPTWQKHGKGFKPEKHWGGKIHHTKIVTRVVRGFARANGVPTHEVDCCAAAAIVHDMWDGVEGIDRHDMAPRAYLSTYTFGYFSRIMAIAEAHHGPKGINTGWLDDPLCVAIFYADTAARQATWDIRVQGDAVDPKILPDGTCARCPQCQHLLTKRWGKWDTRFWGCTRFPRCDYIAPMHADCFYV